MKRLVIMMMLIILLVPAQALAADQGRDIVLFGNSATIEAGETVGRVIVFGGGATIHGTVSDDVVVFGGEALITGDVYGNVITFGGRPQIEAGQVEGDVVAFGAGPTISTTIGGDVLAFGGSARLLDGAIVNGSIFTFGGTLDRNGNASINGSINELLSVGLGWTHSLLPGFAFFGLGLFKVWSLLILLLLGWLIYALLPKHVAQVANAVSVDPAKSVFFGFLGYLAIIPVIIAMAVTVLGIPLIPVVLLAIAVGRLLGQVALGLTAGKWLASRFNLEPSAIIATLLGLAGLGLLSFVPVIGFTLSLLYGLIGFGAVLRSRFGTKPVSA